MSWGGVGAPLQSPAMDPSPWQAWLSAGGARAPFEEQWRRFEEMSAARDPALGPLPSWLPDPAPAAATNLAPFMKECGFTDVPSFHAWTVAEPELFWGKALRRIGVRYRTPPSRILDLSGGAEHPRWLPGARLNATDSCFLGPEEAPALLLGREGTEAIVVVSRGELLALANRFARGLLARGLVPGDAVALYMPLNVECVAAYLGIVRAGMRAVSIADSFPPVEIARRLALGEARAVVAADGYLRAGKRVDLYGKVREAGAPMAIVTGTSPATTLRPGDLRFEEFLDDSSVFDGVEGDPDAVTNVLFSSGTTGSPKAIPWTHLTPFKAAVDGHLHHDIRPGDVVAWPTNIGWMMGPWLVYASLVNGAAMAVFEGSPGEAASCRFFGRAGVTLLGVVPSLVRAWRASGAAAGAGWTALRAFSSTGEASSREDYLWLQSLAGFRAPVIEYCGGTEIGGGYVTGTMLQAAAPACFTTAAFGVDFLLRDGEGRVLEREGEGEVLIKPPSLGLSQVLLNADHHAVYYEGVPPGPRGEILRRHGDAMERLPGWFLRAQGRTDDTMKLGGIKVGALEIERVVAGDPRVVEAAAVSVRLPGEGAERLVLFVVARGEVDRAGLAKDLGRLIHEGLNPLFRVHDLVLVEALPRTASNKLLRRELRARYGG